MLLFQLQNYLQTAEVLELRLPDGSRLPAHFHLTEVGRTTKQFMDCGGTHRSTNRISLQLWVSAADPDHRLSTQKFLRILAAATNSWEAENWEVEVEYQTDTIGRYGLELVGPQLTLTPTQTACLALESCGLPNVISQTFTPLTTAPGCCQPGAVCC